MGVLNMDRSDSCEVLTHRAFICFNWVYGYVKFHFTLKVLAAKHTFENLGTK